jgi:histone acetyltransferase MYST1
VKNRFQNLPFKCNLQRYTTVTKDGITLPLDIGTRVQCRWRDAQLYPAGLLESTWFQRVHPIQSVFLVSQRLLPTSACCRYDPVRVIERRQGQSGPQPEEYEYYVHYEQFNRRLDTWVTIADMDVSTAEQEEVGPDGKKKRKHEEHDEVGGAVQVESS